MKKKLNISQLADQFQPLYGNNLKMIKGGLAQADDPTIDGGSLGEVTITPNKSYDTTSLWSLGLYDGGMNYETGYLPSNDYGSGGGGGSSSGGSSYGGGNPVDSTYVFSHTNYSVKVMDNILGKLKSISTAGILTGKEGEYVTVNHTVLDGKYDGVDITLGGVVTSIGTDGVGIGLAINGTAYTIGTHGIAGVGLTAATTQGSVVVSNSIVYESGIMAQLGAVLSQINSDDVEDAISSLESWAQEVTESPILP